MWRLPLFTILAAMTLGACGKTESADLCLMEEEEPLSAMAFDKPDALEVPFYISSTMVVNPEFTRRNRGGTAKEICTTHAYKELLNRILQLYASIDDFNVTFRYAGLLKSKMSISFDEFQEEGALYIILNDPSLLPPIGAAGMGAPRGPWGPPRTAFNDIDERPTTYPGGSLILAPEHDLHTLIHEIGHALGLTHIPSASTQMSYQGQHSEGFNLGSYYKITEQERADLIAAFPAPGAEVYTISGTVKAAGALDCQELCQAEGGPILVHAANVVTGQAYTALGFLTDDPEVFEFDLNVLEPGSYKVMTGLLPNGQHDPSTRETSWYVDAETGTNDPAGATVLTLSDANPRHDDIQVVLSEEPATSWLDVLIRLAWPRGDRAEPRMINNHWSVIKSVIWKKSGNSG